jgi:hypothetical protein
MACKSGRSEDNHENSIKQFIYAMNNKSNGKSRLMCGILEPDFAANPVGMLVSFGSTGKCDM